MSLWQRYNTLQPRTRMIMGISVMAYAGIALYLADSAEKAFGYEASEEEKMRLRESVPRFTFVEREDGGKGVECGGGGESSGE